MLGMMHVTSRRPGTSIHPWYPFMVSIRPSTSCYLIELYIAIHVVIGSPGPSRYAQGTPGPIYDLRSVTPYSYTFQDIGVGFLK